MPLFFVVLLLVSHEGDSRSYCAPLPIPYSQFTILNSIIPPQDVQIIAEIQLVPVTYTAAIVYRCVSKNNSASLTQRFAVSMRQHEADAMAFAREGFSPSRSIIPIRPLTSLGCPSCEDRHTAPGVPWKSNYFQSSPSWTYLSLFAVAERTQA